MSHGLVASISLANPAGLALLGLAVPVVLLHILRPRRQAVTVSSTFLWRAIERPVSPHDFHATILHSLGLDANRLTYRHHGRDEVPTVFGGKAVTEVFG